jgi:hypothetical protein
VLTTQDLQAKLSEAISKTHEILPQLIDREQAICLWYKQLRLAFNQLSGTFQELDSKVLLNEKAHHQFQSELKGEFITDTIRLDLREISDAMDGLSKAQSNLCRLWLHPLDTVTSRLDFELVELAKLMYNALDTHSGKALNQIKTISKVMSDLVDKREFNWICPLEGEQIDHDRHLIIDYRVGDGKMSTVSDLVRPGYELLREGKLIDRVHAKIVVFR